VTDVDFRKLLLEERQDRYADLLAAERAFRQEQLDNLYGVLGEVRKIAHHAMPRTEYNLFHEALSKRVTSIYWVISFLLLMQAACTWAVLYVGISK
jgi:hypothetical protein